MLLLVPMKKRGRKSKKSAGERLDAVYDKIRAEVGENRPLFHGATVDGWKLHMATSDFGDLGVFVQRGEGEALEIIGFSAGEEAGEWYPATMLAEPAGLALVADLCERAEWHDKLPT